MKDLVWVRECQECGNYQTATAPNMGKELSDAYRNAKCRKCRSEGSLDYGRFVSVKSSIYLSSTGKRA